MPLLYNTHDISLEFYIFGKSLFNTCGYGILFESDIHIYVNFFSVKF